MSSRHHLPQYSRRTPTFDEKVAQVADTVGVQPRGVPSTDLTTRVVALEAASAAGPAWTAITGKPSTFPPSAHTHVDGDIASLSWTKVTGKPTVFPPEAHTQDWSTITGKPSTFAPASHTHTTSDIIGLGGSVATLTGNQTFSGRNSFTQRVNIDRDGLVGTAADYLRDTAGMSGNNYAPLTVWANPSQTDLNSRGEGYNAGFKLLVMERNDFTPGKTGSDVHAVAQTIAIDNAASRKHLWGLNVVGQSLSAFGTDAEVQVIELEMHNQTGFSESNDYGGLTKIGLMLTNSLASSQHANGAIRIWSGANDGSYNGWWNKGILVSRCVKTGLEFSKNPGGSSDYRTAFSTAAIHDRSDSARVLYVEGSHTYGIDTTGASFSGEAWLMKEEQALRWSYSGDSSRAMSIRMSTNGALQVKAHGFDSNLSLKVMNFYGDTKFQVAIQSDNPMYVMVNGSLKQVTQGDDNSGGSGFRVLRVPN